MKSLKSLLTLILVILMSTIFMSCESDSIIDPQPPVPPVPVEPESKPTFIGEWYEEQITDETMGFYTIEYKEDGTCKIWSIVGGTALHYFNNYDGTYKLYDNDKKLSLNYVSPFTGENTTDDYDVKSLGRFSYSIYNQEYDITENLNRIILNYNMKVGETIQLKVDDIGFVPTSYSSAIERVATVDANGNIKAVKRGFSFIRVMSDKEKAIIRVQVTDPENIVDSYLQYLGISTSELNQIFGDNYKEGYVSGKLIHIYYPVDNIEEQVGFYISSNDYVTQTVSILRDEADFNAIKSSFDKKYTLVKEDNMGYYYSAEKDGRLIEILFSEKNKGIRYKVLSNSPIYMKYDGLINMYAHEAADYLGYSITAEDDSDGIFSAWLNNDEYFDRVNVSYNRNTDQIKFVRLRCNQGVTRADIEDYYKSDYVATDDAQYPYSLNHVHVGFEEENGRTYVVYLIW